MRLSHATRHMHDGAVAPPSSVDLTPRTTADEGHHGDDRMTSEPEPWIARERERLVPPSRTSLPLAARELPERASPPEPVDTKTKLSPLAGQTPSSHCTVAAPTQKPHPSGGGRYPELTRPSLSPSRVASTPPSHLRMNKARYGSSPGKSKDDREQLSGWHEYAVVARKSTEELCEIHEDNVR